MNLWFGNSYGELRIIAQCSSPEEVNKAIDDFIAECNKKKHEKAVEKYGPKYSRSKIFPFTRYYTRIWEEDGMVKYDVGSHTEFFYWEGPIEAYMENKK